MTILQKKLKRVYLYSMPFFLLTGLFYINYNIIQPKKDLQDQITLFYKADFNNNTITNIANIYKPDEKGYYKSILTNKSSNYLPLVTIDESLIDSIVVGKRISKKSNSYIFQIISDRSILNFTLKDIDFKITQKIIGSNLAFIFSILLTTFIIYIIPSKYLAIRKM
jgi:hypothetical protein